MNKQELTKLLNENDAPVRVTFTKKDGTVRTMDCTTNLRMIDEDFHPYSKGTRTTPDHIVNVFDVNLNEWRCFIFDNVTDIQPLEILYKLAGISTDDTVVQKHFGSRENFESLIKDTNSSEYFFFEDCKCVTSPDKSCYLIFEKSYGVDNKFA